MSIWLPARCVTVRWVTGVVVLRGLTRSSRGRSREPYFELRLFGCPGVPPRLTLPRSPHRPLPVHVTPEAGGRDGPVPWTLPPPLAVSTREWNVCDDDRRGSDTSSWSPCPWASRPATSISTSSSRAVADGSCDLLHLVPSGPPAPGSLSPPTCPGPHYPWVGPDPELGEVPSEGPS